jgi:hypothetical protein
MKAPTTGSILVGSVLHDASNEFLVKIGSIGFVFTFDRRDLDETFLFDLLAFADTVQFGTGEI